MKIQLLFVLFLLSCSNGKQDFFKNWPLFLFLQNSQNGQLSQIEPKIVRSFGSEASLYLQGVSPELNNDKTFSVKLDCAGNQGFSKEGFLKIKNLTPEKKYSCKVALKTSQEERTIPVEIKTRKKEPILEQVSYSISMKNDTSVEVTEKFRIANDNSEKGNAYRFDFDSNVVQTHSLGQFQAYSPDSIGYKLQLGKILRAVQACGGNVDLESKIKDHLQDRANLVAVPVYPKSCLASILVVVNEDLSLWEVDLKNQFAFRHYNTSNGMKICMDSALSGKISVCTMIDGNLGITNLNLNRNPQLRFDVIDFVVGVISSVFNGIVWFTQNALVPITREFLEIQIENEIKKLGSTNGRDLTLNLDIEKMTVEWGKEHSFDNMPSGLFGLPSVGDFGFRIPELPKLNWEGYNLSLVSSTPELQGIGNNMSVSANFSTPNIVWPPIFPDEDFRYNLQLGNRGNQSGANMQVQNFPLKIVKDAEKNYLPQYPFVFETKTGTFRDFGWQSCGATSLTMALKMTTQQNASPSSLKEDMFRCTSFQNGGFSAPYIGGSKVKECIEKYNISYDGAIQANALQDFGKTWTDIKSSLNKDLPVILGIYGPARNASVEEALLAQHIFPDHIVLIVGYAEDISTSRKYFLIADSACPKNPVNPLSRNRKCLPSQEALTWYEFSKDFFDSQNRDWYQLIKKL